MKVIVPIKQILDPRGITFRRDRERMFINREEYIVDPASKAALEAALRLKDSNDAHLIALSVGEPRADDALREALAMGCDAACLLSDVLFKDADISAIARILSEATKKLGGADLIVAGRAAGDTSAGQIGPRLAEALDYAQITDVYLLAVEGGALQVTRRWGKGYARVRCSLPAIVTVAPEAFPPRYAHGARIMRAYREWQVPVWTGTDLELSEADLSALLIRRSQSFPPPLPVGEKFRGDPESVAQDAITMLNLQKLI
jgi:electron transfer flavoprotein beta subunit